MSVITWGSAGSKAETELVQGSTIGTLKLKVSDVQNEVRDILFNVVAIDADNNEIRRSGPHPPDITRRPGWYEKDVVLDASLRTRVEVILRGEGGNVLLGPATTYGVFGVRAPTASGAGEVRVQDADTPATVAGTLVFQGEVVSVADRVATFDLDGRYATQTGVTATLASYYSKAASDERYAQIGHTHAYLPLGGGTITGGLNLSVGNLVLGADPNGGLDLGDSLGSGTPFIDFHKGVGAQQDFNVRFVNSGSDYMHVQFAAGTGTFNVAGTIAQSGIPVSLSGHHHDGRYAAASHTHEYLPLAGGTVTGSAFFAAGLNAGGVRSTTNLYLGNDGAYLHLSNTAAQFLTSGSGALQGRFGSLVLSHDYLHAQHVPPNGMWVAGGTSLAALTTRDLLTVQGGMRFANGGNLQANRTDGTVDNVFWPRWTDNNTYLNYGGGGYFYIRDNANSQRLTFAPDGAAFTTWVQARGPNGYDLRLGGSRNAAMAWISTTPNLHLDSPNGWNIYLNHVSNRPVNIGTIDQSTYKLAVSGDALVTGWFRNSQPGHGLYNEALGRHLYAGADWHNSGWNITGGAGETFLALRETYGGAPRGWLFSNADGFGLLHSGRGWAVRVHTAGVQLYGSTHADSLQVNGNDPNYRVYVGGSIKVAGNVDVGGNMFDPYGRPLASYEISGGTPAQAGNPAARHGTLWLVVE